MNFKILLNNLEKSLSHSNYKGRQKNKNLVKFLVFVFGKLYEIHFSLIFVVNFRIFENNVEITFVF